MIRPHFISKDPPHIYKWLCSLLCGEDCLPFPVLPGVTDKTKNIITVSWCYSLAKLMLITFNLKFLKQTSHKGFSIGMMVYFGFSCMLCYCLKIVS